MNHAKPANQELPVSPNLLQLKHQAKDLQKAFNQRDESARQRVIEHHPNLMQAESEPLKRSDAYHVLAREYGFASWSQLKKFIQDKNSGHISKEELQRNKNLQTTELSRMAQEAYAAYLFQSSEIYKRIRKHFIRFENASDDDIQNGIFTSVDAHQLIAMEHGYADWSAFLDSFEDAVDEVFEEAVDAIVEGDIDWLRALLKQHPKIITAKSSRKHKVTLLHYCSANGVEDYRQKTPPNAVEIMELLLQSGAEPDASAHTYYGNVTLQTTMNLLVTSIHPQKAGLQGVLVKTLVKYGAKVNGLNDDGYPLAAAIAHNCSPAVAALVECGARVDNLIMAAASGNLEYVSQCLDGNGKLKQDANILNVDCLHMSSDPVKAVEQALYFAAKHGQSAVVKYLLEQGVNPNAPQHENQTPLHWSAFNGHLNCVKLLIGAGANPSNRDKRWNSSAYVWAAEDKQTHVMNYLKENALLDIFDAVETGEITLVRQCLKYDPESVNAPDGKGIPIRIAAYHGHEEIAKVLLEHGADPSLHSSEGKSASAIAKERGHQQIVKLFQKEF